MEFSVDAYTAAVEAEFAADFSVDSYTAQVEAECLKPFQFDTDNSEHDEDDDWGGAKKKEKQAEGKTALLTRLSTGSAMSTMPIGTRDLSLTPREEKLTFLPNVIDMVNFDPYFKCHCQRLMILLLSLLGTDGCTRQSPVSLRRK